MLSNITSETVQLMEMLPQNEQCLALNFVKAVLNAWRMENEIPNAETIAALEEGQDMLNHPEKYKGYATFREFMDEMDCE